ncbi:unnamed protein product [Ambrosiozyma monospora]|uniref:Unnamed protein product n=1 Tax=Ambrosiozyma monospora TaxID=43982 RepID=A0ACB5T9V3_AMBMO|nr:unnamed protein product [Ambrosiozyma monospora]
MLIDSIKERSSRICEELAECLNNSKATVYLPPVMEDLTIDNVPINGQNIQNVEWLENVHLVYDDYESFAPTIYQLPSYVKEMGDSRAFEEVNLQHLQNLQNHDFNCFEFLRDLDDILKWVKYLDCTLVLGHLTLRLNSQFKFCGNGSPKTPSLVWYIFWHMMSVCGNSDFCYLFNLE